MDKNDIIEMLSWNLVNIRKINKLIKSCTDLELLVVLKKIKLIYINNYYYISKSLQSI